MRKAIVGRRSEIERLEKYVDSDKSEFVAVYGRRRVGKTFLIKELFEGSFTFRMTGKENASMTEQLNNFSYSMYDYFEEKFSPKNWNEAFRMLSKMLEKKGKGPKIIFIDEMPWLDTPKSKFISALEYFWNSWAYYRSDVKLIVCGSATSWMLSKLINSRGGLHNRVTHKMLISPFTLQETEEFFLYGGFGYERSEIIDCYMAVGGVAYYLSLFERGKSVAENINSMCFTRGGELTDEFDKLYGSLFKKAENHIAVIKALGTVAKGMTRLDLIAKTKSSDNGNFTMLLNELEVCEFIRSYVQFGKGKKEKMYQLIDEFSLFYLHFMGKAGTLGKDYWLKMVGTNEYKVWSGYAFEIVCLHHIDQITGGLGIGGIINKPCSWLYRPSKSDMESEEKGEEVKKGAQIDLLIDRKDKTISVCEMKYSDGEYVIDKNYDRRVQERLNTFKAVTKTGKSIQVVYITPQGLYDNVYARRVRQVKGDDLFGK